MGWWSDQHPTYTSFIVIIMRREVNMFLMLLSSSSLLLLWCYGDIFGFGIIFYIRFLVGRHYILCAVNANMNVLILSISLMIKQRIHHQPYYITQVISMLNIDTFDTYDDDDDDWKWENLIITICCFGKMCFCVCVWGISKKAKQHIKWKEFFTTQHRLCG
mgnify:CR=1 FL=1